MLLRLRKSAELLESHHSRQMAPFGKKSFCICKRIANEDDGKWPHKLCNGTNFHSNTACRFCGGARPPWAGKAGAGAKTTADVKNDSMSKGKGKGKGKHLGKGAGKGQKPEKLDEAV